MISLENISKSFGSQDLFDQTGLKINSRERVGIVGRNGHGKTTLFSIITGTSTPDSGNILIPNNYRLGYVQQHIGFTEDTVLKEGVLGLTEHERDQHWKVEKILAGLGFSTDDFHRHPSEFSGGYQVRLNLAKVLVSEPDMLLLDEPTNYLDITSIRWIEGFLNRWPGELLLITHDRSFMDAVVTHTAGIHRQKIRKIEGNTEKFYTQIALDEEIYEKTRVNDEKKRKDLDLFITRFRAKARLANMVQSRVKTLSKMEKKDKLDAMKVLGFSFRSREFSAKQMMTVGDLAFSYTPESPLIKNVNVNIASGDRICIIGKNGKGKTTLLKLLAGELSPGSGSIKKHDALEAGFYEQTNVKSLDDSKTVASEIEYTHPDVDKQHARGICGAMMFEGDMALKKISVLSGGEKSRVMLGKLLVTPLNLLFLDEPTNHLDMDSCDSLLSAIDNFDGAVVMVTHNEMYLHALAKRLIVFKNNRIDVFEGSYSEFLEKEGWDEDEGVGETPSETVVTETKLGKKELRKLRSDIIARKSKELGPLKKEIDRLENEIELCEEKVDALNQEMIVASETGGGTRIAGLSKELHEYQERIDTCFDDLEVKTDLYDEKNIFFIDELERLDNQ